MGTLLERRDIQAQIVNVSIDMLLAAKAMGHSADVKKFRKQLAKDVALYNAMTKQAKKTGLGNFPPAPKTLAEDVCEGRPYERLTRAVDRGTDVPYTAPHGAESALLASYDAAEERRLDRAAAADRYPDTPDPLLETVPTRFANKKEYMAFIKRHEDAIADCRAERRKLDAMGSTLTARELIYRSMVNQERITRLHVEVLTAACQMKDDGRKKRYVTLTTAELRAYNGWIGRLNREDGARRVGADTEIPQRIVKGQTYPPIPSYEVGAESSAAGKPLGAPAVLTAADTPRKLAAAAKKMMALDVALVAARYDAAISQRKRALFDEKHAYFTPDPSVRRGLKSEITALKVYKKRAVKQQKADNRRYMSALLSPVPKHTTSEDARNAFISHVENLKHELDVRNGANLALAVLYDLEKADKVYRKEKKLQSEKQRKEFRRVDKLNTSTGNRNTVNSLLDERSTLKATIAALEVQKKIALHKRCMGVVDALTRELDLQAQTLLSVERTLRGDVKRAKNIHNRRNARSEVIKSLFWTVVGLLLVAVALLVVGYFMKWSFVMDLLAKYLPALAGGAPAA